MTLEVWTHEKVNVHIRDVHGIPVDPVKTTDWNKPILLAYFSDFHEFCDWFNTEQPKQPLELLVRDA